METTKLVSLRTRGSKGGKGSFAKRVIANGVDSPNIQRNNTYVINYIKQSIPDIIVKTESNRTLLVFCIDNLTLNRRTALTGIRRYRKRLIHTGQYDLTKSSEASLRILFKDASKRVDRDSPNGNTFGEWATKYNYIWAEGDEIPVEWLME